MLTDETIRKISEEERNSAGLSKLPNGFREDVSSYIENKEKMTRSDSDKWALESVRRRIKTIFERRERKILNSAHGFIDSGAMPDNMAEEEKKLFGSVVECLNAFRKERSGGAEKKEESLVMVSILDGVEKFVGINMKNYGPFSKGDIATIPEANAGLLIQKGLAEKVETPDK